MNIPNRFENPLTLYLNYTCELLYNSDNYSDHELSRVLKSVGDELEKCGKLGRFCSIESFKKLLFGEVPSLTALLDEDGVLDYIEKKNEESSHYVLNLKGVIALLIWKIYN